MAWCKNRLKHEQYPMSRNVTNLGQK